MKKVRVIKRVEPQELLGKAFAVCLKNGELFYFKASGFNVTYSPDEPEEYKITGVDDEGQELEIDIDKIDFVAGGN